MRATESRLGSRYRPPARGMGAGLGDRRLRRNLWPGARHVRQGGAARVAPARRGGGLTQSECEWYIMAMKMHQTVISLTQPQLAFLRAEAQRLGISVSDLIRRIVDQHRETLRNQIITGTEARQDG